MSGGSAVETTPVPILAASFDRAARSYRANAHVQEAMADWLAEWLPAAREGRALEIGAGPGVFTERLLPWRGSLVATDISPAMCAMGRVALPHVHWLTMAAEAPEDGPWDWIFCSSMLQWTPQPEDVLAAWRERLAVGGRVLAGMFVMGSLPELGELLDQPLPLAWRTADEWRECLTRGGLRVVRDAVDRRVFWHTSAIALLRSLHETGTAPERRVSPVRLRRLLKEYESRHGCSLGVHATWSFYRFEAARAGVNAVQMVRRIQADSRRQKRIRPRAPTTGTDRPAGCE